MTVINVYQKQTCHDFALDTVLVERCTKYQVVLCVKFIKQNKNQKHYIHYFNRCV